MAKFHLNDKGVPGACTAKNGKCPFGGEHQHYDSMSKAQSAYELSMGASAFTAATHSKHIPQSPLTGLPYPTKGDRVKMSMHLGASDAAHTKYEGQEADVEDFTGTYYEVKFADGERAQIHYGNVSFAPGHDTFVPVEPVSSDDEPADYPVEGDEVMIGSNIGAYESSLSDLAGQKGEVVEFTGTYYHVKFANGEVHKIHHNALQKDDKFSLDLNTNDETPYGRVIAFDGDNIGLRDDKGLGSVGQIGNIRWVPRSAVIESIERAARKKK